MIQGKTNNKNNFREIGILFFLIILLQVPALAQTTTLKSRVLDKVTNDPLFGANAIIDGTSLGAASDLDGRFIIRNVPLGKQKLIISYIGYNQLTVELDVKSNNEIVDYFLEPKTLEGETVVITAQAEGQLSAINQQLTSNTIANIVAKDRIKELPDVNAAETIGRLPGVSIQRYGGEATKIEIRGLNPKYSLITVNGVELPATGTDDRSVDLSLVSSNMLDGIILKKSNTPDMDADVLGGTVDLKLKEASTDFNLNLSAQGGYNKLQNYYGNYNFTASVSNRFLDNTLGVILNANIDNYDRSADKFKDNWQNYNGVPATGELIVREEQVNRKRTGASLLLDYIIPNGKLNSSIFFNQLNSEGLNHISQLNTPQNKWATNRHIYQLEQYKSATNVFTSFVGLNQDFDWIRYDFGISRSGTANSTPERKLAEFTQEQSALLPGSPWDISPFDLVNYYNVDTIITNLSAMYIYGTRTIENTTTTKLNFEIPYILSDQLSGYIKTGAKLKWIDRSNDQSQNGNSGLQYGSGQSNPVFLYLNRVFPEWGIEANVNEYQLLNILPFLSNYKRENFLNGIYPLGLIPDKNMMLQMIDALKSAPDSLNIWYPYSVGNLGSDYSGFERYEAAYLMSEINLEDYLTVIPGVRWEGDYTSYNGQRYSQVTSGIGGEAPPAELVKLNKKRKHSFWLPMISIVARPTDWLQIRIAGTKTLARPDFLRYAPISYISGSGDQIIAANYSLKPSQSTNFDLGVSVFNNEIGLLSINTFYKNIKDLIFYSGFKIGPGIEPDPSLEIPESWTPNNKTPTIDAYRNNPDPAKYSGFEIEWQTRFWYLPSVFNGIVLNINYTHIYSEMKLAYDSLVIKQVGTRRTYSLYPTSVKTRMPDQPSHILNLTIGYDIGDFSARLSYLYQTNKLTQIGYEGVIPTTKFSSYTGGYGRWDLTLQQKFYQNLNVFLNLTNLNNRPDKSFIGSKLANPNYIEYYGFTMDFGIRYSLN